VEDHDLEYANFEGEIPEGQYGAGKVKIWDKGKYEIIEKNQKKLKFKLFGKKLKGIYELVNFKDKNWLLFKVEE
ncbi:MAG: DNA polymerase ligase N-terminal domain-containing protein, partial [Minisyncoccia bacterium]